MYVGTPPDGGNMAAIDVEHVCWAVTVGIKAAASTAASLMKDFIFSDRVERMTVKNDLKLATSRKKGREKTPKNN